MAFFAAAVAATARGSAMTKVLFVCMGNICRSPMAEGLFRKALRDAGLEDRVHVDSAGTHAYHVGDPPDPRAQAAVRRRGVDIGGLRGRQVADSDFAEFDHILVMDGANYDHLTRRAPAEHRHKIRRILSFSRRFPNLDVPDPYYGGPQGFEENIAMIEDAIANLVRTLSAGQTQEAPQDVR
jgi:protein-tyrosine phosphatase